METTESSVHVDVDDESVLTSIFKDSFPDSWKSNPEFITYLSELSSYGIEKLVREPERLNDEKAHVLEQTQDLAFHNYKTFIKTAECSKDIFQDFSLIEDKLEGMIKKLPSLSEKAKSFTQATQNISASRKSNSLTLTRHTQILEILEIPQLMDTCVRNQYFDEALELMFYVKRIEKKHIMTDIPVLDIRSLESYSPDIILTNYKVISRRDEAIRAIVFSYTNEFHVMFNWKCFSKSKDHVRSCQVKCPGSIIDDVRRSAQLMLHHLLSQLRTNIQLPACLRIIGYLRRLDCFTEVELSLKFLQARNSWLESLLNAIPNEDAYTHVTRTIEACRIHLFDIVTQYRAIFSDETDLTFSYLPSQRSNDNLGDKPRDTSVFHSWLVHRISLFLDTLEKDLARGVGNRLDSVLGQCMYFGLSFSRVGADFRCLLIPRFQEAAHGVFKQAVDNATQEFAMDMMSYSLVTTSVAYNQSITSLMSPNSNSSMTTSGTAILSPPSSLLEFPPLAVYLNNSLTAFNDLRLCCPVALAPRVASSLVDSLRCVVADILGFYHTEETAFTERERASFKKFCTSFCEVLIPYMNECLSLLFPPHEIGSMFGITPSQFKSRFEKFGHLEVSEVIEPLKEFLPVKEAVEFESLNGVKGDGLSAAEEKSDDETEAGLTMTLDEDSDKQPTIEEQDNAS